MGILVGTNLPNRTPDVWYRTRGNTPWKREALNTRRRTSANVPTGGVPLFGTQLYFLPLNLPIPIPIPAAVTSENESLASVLTNTTSTGDAGNRADHFLGGALGSRWSSSYGSTPTVAYSAAVLGTGTSGIAQPYTPTGALQIEARVMVTGSDSGAQGVATIGIMVRDSMASDTAGNGMFIRLQSSSSLTSCVLFELTGGAYTQQGNPYPNNTDQLLGWVYLRLARDGANNWTAFVSQERVFWAKVGNTVAFTFTPAFLCVRYSIGTDTTIAGSVDFVDVTL